MESPGVDLLLFTGSTRVPLVLFSRLAFLAPLPVSYTDSDNDISQPCNLLQLPVVVHPLRHDHRSSPLHTCNSTRVIVASKWRIITRPRGDVAFAGSRTHARTKHLQAVEICTIVVLGCQFWAVSSRNRRVLRCCDEYDRQVDQYFGRTRSNPRGV